MPKSAKQQLVDKLRCLREQYPDVAEQFSLDKTGLALGWKRGEVVYVMYAAPNGFREVIDCQKAGATVPAEEW
jgi:hypothetical protein